MKKILSIAFLVIGMVANAQIHFIDKEYFTASFAVDPSSSIKEEGLDIVAEIEVVSYWKYAKFNVQSFTVLDGGYLDATGGFGINLTSGHFDQWRAYTGIRLGVINREKYVYPLFGYEGGVDYYFRNMFVGVRGTGDWRSDFMYSDAVPEMQYSGYVRVGFKF
ncbi:hypothetical protein [Flavobacterium sp.]|uniref:hypothetical protein n=1 Tax=Flavobacterium sp. TaxID=239 RepID=UPI003D6A0411